MNERAQDAVIVEEKKSDAPAAEAPKAEAQKPGPAQDLRNIQMLIVSGIFPGNVAPQVVSAYQLLEKMAQKVELDAAHEAEFKARQKA